VREDKKMRRQGYYIILINIKKIRFSHWNEEVKTKIPEKLVPSPLLLDVKLQKQSGETLRGYLHLPSSLTC
jgi:hypothetical protein